MSKPILVANWKSHPNSIAEVKSIFKGLLSKKILYKKLSFFVAPPFPYMDVVSEKVRSIGYLASQDISTISKTATGIVSTDILKSFGVKLAIIGHSEARERGETSQDISEKVKMALKVGITPLICIGELTRDNDGDYFNFLRNQLEDALMSLNKKTLLTSGLAVAYEPVWAIGADAKGVVEPKDLSQIVIFIKKVMSDMFGRAFSDKTPILYGGSVDPSNAPELIKGTGINGFLVGRASLGADSLGKIAKILIDK